MFFLQHHYYSIATTTTAIATTIIIAVIIIIIIAIRLLHEDYSNMIIPMQWLQYYYSNISIPLPWSDTLMPMLWRLLLLPRLLLLVLLLLLLLLVFSMCSTVFCVSRKLWKCQISWSTQHAQSPNHTPNHAPATSSHPRPTSPTCELRREAILPNTTPRPQSTLGGCWWHHVEWIVKLPISVGGVGNDQTYSRRVVINVGRASLD